MEKNDPRVQVGTLPAADIYSIAVTTDGPYVVRGKPLLAQKIIMQDSQGHSWSYTDGQSFELAEQDLLCRCGRSANAPFCDGSHSSAGADLQETASFAPLLDSAEIYRGPTRTLADSEAYCAFGRFCDAGDRIWAEVKEGRAESDRLTERMAHHCPAGRLLVFDNSTGQPVEMPVPPSLGLIEDPAIGVSGPIMVSGGIRVVSADGRVYEVRNRQAICRCGRSANKPFCDGSHASVRFKDDLSVPGKGE